MHSLKRSRFRSIFFKFPERIENFIASLYTAFLEKDYRWFLLFFMRNHGRVAMTAIEKFQQHRAHAVRYAAWHITRWYSKSLILAGFQIFLPERKQKRNGEIQLVLICLGRLPSKHLSKVIRLKHSFSFTTAHCSRCQWQFTPFRRRGWQWTSSWNHLSSGSGSSSWRANWLLCAASDSFGPWRQW